MPLQLIREDITRLRVDAVVNAANTSLLGGGGVDGAIHAAAGPELLRECRSLGGCRAGEAKLTLAYRLPCRYIIHTVGPVWEGGARGEEALLRSCYRNSLQLAEERSLESLAFPLISAGAYAYPAAEALRVAEEEIGSYLAESGSAMRVYLILYGRNAAGPEKSLSAQARAFIEQSTAVPEQPRERGLFGKARRTAEPAAYAKAEALPCCESLPEKKEPQNARKAAAAPAGAGRAGEGFTVDEGFSAMLLRKIDERGLTDAECYKRANVDRRLFSKIRSNPAYRPAKTTVLAFAVALRLDLAETRELLLKAGYALSRSFLQDVIVEYCIGKQIYNIYDVNELLFSYDQPQLGSL